MELAERASAKHGERKLKVRMSDGHMARGTRQVADVKRPPTSVAKMVAAGNRAHLAIKDPRMVRPKGEVTRFHWQRHR